MENMDKGLTVPKWVLINWPKIPQMPKNLSAQIVCPCPKNFDENRLDWASVVRGSKYNRHFLQKSVFLEFGALPCCRIAVYFSAKRS